VLPFQDIVANPARVNRLPEPLKLAANVTDWLNSVASGVKARSLIDFSRPGSVLVVGNAAAVKDPDIQEPDRISSITKRLQKGRLIRGKVHGASADVLNGNVASPHLQSQFGSWKAANSLTQKSLPQTIARNDERLIVDHSGLVDNAQHPQHGGTASAQWDYVHKRIFINAHVEDGSMLVHEYFHTFDVDGRGAETFGWYMDEGFTDFFARDVAARYKYAYKGNWAYENGYRAVRVIVDELGLDRVCKLYMERTPALISLVAPASREIADIAFSVGAGGLDPASANVKKAIDAFLTAARSWSGWPTRHWDVKMPDKKPFRSQG
jgi:hypothetical protein